MARRGVLGLCERDLGRLELGRPRLRLGDDGLPVEKQNAPVLGGDRERPVERRRQPERHLGRPVDEGCEAACRVATIRRVASDRGSACRS